MRIAVIGARGQLGAAIVHECARHDIVPFAHADLDITDDRAVARAIERAAPNAIVNCAAYNDVDGAEDHPVQALNVNAFAVRALARAAAACDAALVHYGTDFVFDGTAAAPYTEEDRPNPKSAYAVSKLLGEWFATDAPRAYVLRVESLFGQAPGGPAPKGTVAGLLNAISEGREAKVFDDRTVSPTHVADAARATRELLERGAPAGLYHCVSSGFCTWQQFAEEAARQMGAPNARLTAVHMADVPMRAPRPQYCALSNRKLASLGILMPSWQEALAAHIRTLAIPRRDR